jgi:hypothetical protein
MKRTIQKNVEKEDRVRFNNAWFVVSVQGCW